ncbi:MAG: hypothetical protein K2X48_03220 [Chitinophagaceae bacterium]|nr:hypothetical protein [Chitinophagaceae bacterium]
MFIHIILPADVLVAFILRLPRRMRGCTIHRSVSSYTSFSIITTNLHYQ